MANPSPDDRSPNNAGLIRCLLGASLLLGGLGVTFASLIGHGIIFFYGAVVVGAILMMQGFDMVYVQAKPQKPTGWNLPDSVPSLIYVWIVMGVTATVGVGYILAPVLRSMR
jgi:hypothetical protein